MCWHKSHQSVQQSIDDMRDSRQLDTENNKFSYNALNCINQLTTCCGVVIAKGETELLIRDWPACPGNKRR